jgi:hypothetical protein
MLLVLDCVWSVVGLEGILYSLLQEIEVGDCR